MNIYQYYNYNTKQVVLKVIAQSIVEADEEFQSATGINPLKSSYIGCSITKEESDVV